MNLAIPLPTKARIFKVLARNLRIDVYSQNRWPFGLNLPIGFSQPLRNYVSTKIRDIIGVKLQPDKAVETFESSDAKGEINYFHHMGSPRVKRSMQL